MDDLPAGRFFCRRCFCQRDFVLVPEASPDDREAAIECFVCGYVYGKVTKELDEQGRKLAVPKVEHAMPAEMREAARLRLRDEFVESLLRNGARREAIEQRRRVR